ncbi:DUF4405 domain-containing protein [Thiothrix nivea]|uniref:Flavinylation-associated cytochrome domain-containing protein n=1 Tax=Thiothrix nivea (strain ATCC 35100 / DSM 5205 / JP2) TaxID=870187 RepID=A0A656HFF5_THINJ|nr:DUF4405 domain-containing protein [Thiothrix nivea]EIJ33755.1 hypothetical protein Thini_1135 [Thiothrix nivea DSM 5205]
MDMTTLRRWATPMTIGAFLLMSVTGILMFFHIELGLIKVAHEWLSWLMVLAVGLHITLNWKMFSRYFSQKPAVAVIGLFTVVMVASMLVPAEERRGPPGRGGAMAATQVLMNAPLDKLAGVTGNTLEGLQASLQQQGLTVEATTASLGDIARQNGQNPVELLNKVIAAK